MTKIAVLDDWQGIAEQSAGWAAPAARAEISFFRDQPKGEGTLVARPGALLINTTHGPLADESALIAALATGRIHAALDVYEYAPLPADHSFRRLPNTMFTPHLGHGTHAVFQRFYRQSIENVLAFLDGAPIRALTSA